MKPAKHYEFDVAISYAGEDREFAEALAETLRYHQLNVFYDNFEKPTLWGKNLYSFLSDVYENKAHISQEISTELGIFASMRREKYRRREGKDAGLRELCERTAGSPGCGGRRV